MKIISLQLLLTTASPSTVKCQITNCPGIQQNPQQMHVRQRRAAQNIYFFTFHRVNELLAVLNKPGNHSLDMDHILVIWIVIPQILSLVFQTDWFFLLFILFLAFAFRNMDIHILRIWLGISLCFLPQPLVLGCISYPNTCKHQKLKFW